MKKFLIFLACVLVFSIAVGICALALEVTEVYTANDTLLILRAIIAGESTPAMDVNLDGSVNLLDAFLVLKLAVGGEYDLKLSVEVSSTVGTSGYNWWNLGVQYPRIIVIKNSGSGANGTLLATFEELNSGLVSGKPGYPIYKSTDNGATWERVTVVRDNSTKIQSEWNPHLLELEKPLGKYKAGTILLAGCSVDAAHSSKSAIRLYASVDGGKTFSTPITVAEGGGLDNGVWEPFLMQLDDGRLVCFYSDDSDSAHSQKIVYKVSSDGVNFGEAVDVVASKVSTERPGMAVVTRLGNGKYFMVYEVVDHKSVSGNPIMYRTSDDGLNYGDASNLGTLLVSGSKKALGSAPYCVWTPVGGRNGTLIVSGTFMRSGSSTTGTDYFISRDGGSTWETVPHIIPYNAAIDHCGYSNCMAVSEDGKTLYALNNPIDANVANHAKIAFARAVWQIKK